LESQNGIQYPDSPPQQLAILYSTASGAGHGGASRTRVLTAAAALPAHSRSPVQLRPHKSPAPSSSAAAAAKFTSSNSSTKTIVFIAKHRLMVLVVYFSQICEKTCHTRKTRMNSAVLLQKPGRCFTVFTLFSKKYLNISGKCGILLPS
jgi:hypothetical protein